MTPDPTEDFIREAFEDNFELLQLEGGHGLTADVKEAALNQALLYWRKLRHIAERVTQTEVRLNLPGQTTPAGRQFAIEGVVDIVTEAGRTTMYDIKSHDADYVRANLPFYEQQLNVYAHIWHTLRGEPLDQTAIIATDYPESVKEALAAGDDRQLAQALDAWDPVIEIPFDTTHVAATVEEFANVVDAIEEGRFAPPAVAHLQRPIPGTNTRFATRVCRNCDARFSCAAYRRYAVTSTGGAEHQFRAYFDDFGSDTDREDRRTATLDGAPALADLVD